MSRIFVSEPQLKGREAEYVQQVIASGRLTQGPWVSRFETEFAKFCGVEHAVATMNGTAALHLALIAAGVRPKDRVIVPALSYVATANAVRYTGATPVFVDVHPDTWCLDPGAVERILSIQKCKAIVPVHLYGVPADMEELQRLAVKHGCVVVEDAAEAHGARSIRRRVGSIGDFGAFSFYGNKIMTCGEGGMVTTHSRLHAETLRLYRGQGMGPKRYWHSVVGYNYRMTELQAALGVAQLEQHDTAARTRERVVTQYHALMPTQVFQQYSVGDTPANWMVTVLVPPGVNRDAVIARMEVDWIETRPAFPLIAHMPPYARAHLRSSTVGELRNSAVVSERGINLPTHGGLTKEDVDRIVRSFEVAIAADADINSLQPTGATV